MQLHTLNFDVLLCHKFPVPPSSVVQNVSPRDTTEHFHSFKVDLYQLPTVFFKKSEHNDTRLFMWKIGNEQ